MPPPPPASPPCINCGTIENIRAVEQPGEASGLGAVAGGMTDGNLRTLSQASEPVWRAGDPVRIENGALVAR